MVIIGQDTLSNHKERGFEARDVMDRQAGERRKGKVRRSKERQALMIRLAFNYGFIAIVFFLLGILVCKGGL